MPNLVVDVNFNDMSEEVKNALKEQILLGLESIGQEGEGYAKDECPVDTGTLRNSISHDVDESNLTAYIGTNVEYAVYVEYRDKANHQTGKAHFLRDAAVNHSSRYKEILELFLKS